MPNKSRKSPREPVQDDRDFPGHAGGTLSASAKTNVVMTVSDATRGGKETWVDWFPHSTDTMTRVALIEAVNRQYRGGLDAEQLQSWEDRGILPQRIQGGYPIDAVPIIQALRTYEDAGMPPSVIRRLLRDLATWIDQTAALDIHDRLVDIRTDEQSRHETWVDWMPPEAPASQLLSHDELLEELRARDITVSAATLEHWRRNGVLPRPVRRAHRGSVRPVYPYWFVPAIQHLRELQAEGRTLEQITPVMRAWASTSVMWTDPLAQPTAVLQGALQEYANALQGWDRSDEIGSVQLNFFDDNGNEIPGFKVGIGLRSNS